MQYRKLGRTNLDVSVVGIGTWQYGGEWGIDYTQKQVDSILSTAKEVGINLIDTAECYGEDHLAEKLVGDFVHRDRREDWVIATKFGHHFNGHLNRIPKWSVDNVLQQLDESLKALKTDYIDLYQFHSGTDEVFFNDALWTALDKQKQAGKIRHLGISIDKNGNDKQIDAASQVNADVIQFIYNRIDRRPEEHAFESIKKQNLGALVRVPLASGYLSGKYKTGVQFPANDVRSGHNQREVESILTLVQEIQQNEVPENVPMSQWALAWCLKNPLVTSVIPGCKNEEQVRLNAEAAELVL